MEFRKESARLPSGELTYLTAGRGDALVCIHPASGVRITPAIEGLAASFKLYLPILPGFDGTERLPGIATMSQLAQLVAAFIEAGLGERVNVSGHSFGGWVACWLAVQRPDLVLNLLLQCPAGFRPAGVGGLDADPVALLAKSYAHPENRRPETKPPEVTASNRRLASTYSLDAASDFDLIDRLHEIAASTLILHGRKDGVIPQASPELLERLIPSSAITYVDDAAHNIEVDQPEEYCRLVRDFFAPEHAHR
jgi:pimeloyl-ACP methyl ester carboxylesterase